MPLPPDLHVHTEWSWDAAHGSMERSCERALEIGLPGIAFTEHADFVVIHKGQRP
ncbi:MAG: PHP domain-containing protein, partial [Candidatus Dormibacteraeota bacterium]|nr:PHP domain-containing protein [Candidatus Dormibacteraeota bacterium]